MEDRGRRFRVLLVEDDEDDFILTRDLLADIRGQQFDVDWAADSAAALEAAARGQYDLYLIDYRLGPESGLDLLRRLVADGCRSPIIMLTGQADRDVDLEAMQAGAADYLVKGTIDAALLERSLRYAIERKRHADELHQLHADLERKVQQRTEALRDADRRKDEFLATLAHELRNPLAPIRNALQILGMPAADRAAQQRARAIIDRQIHQMVRLVDDLLDVSRITRGKIELRLERVELSAVVGMAVETSRPLLEASGHQLTVQLPATKLHLQADATRLAQVVSNLLNNSAKYMEKGGRVWLSVAREGANVVVRVKDTGIGIPAEMLPRVFDMFTQADHSVTRAQGGLGIGLTLVRRLVEMHGGTVEAHSDGPGKGSEFVVRLPLVGEVAPAGGADGKPQQSAERGPSTCRILVVDDNRDSAESLGALLQLLGHDIHLAYDGQTALEAARSLRPQVVVLDIGMPGMSGYEVARRLRQQAEFRTLPLVALTGWGQEEDRRRSEEAGFNYHVVKPVDLDVLGKLLADIGRNGPTK